MARFEVEVLDAMRGVFELRLTGRVYADVAPQLREALEDERLKLLAVDARDLEQIDSSGLGVFVDLLKRIRPRGGRILFYGLNANIARVFEITKLGRVMPVVADRDAAMESLKS